MHNHADHPLVNHPLHQLARQGNESKRNSEHPSYNYFLIKNVPMQMRNPISISICWDNFNKMQAVRTNVFQLTTQAFDSDSRVCAGTSETTDDQTAQDTVNLSCVYNCQMVQSLK